MCVCVCVCVRAFVHACVWCVDVIKYLVKECIANVNGESSVVAGLASFVQLVVSLRAHVHFV